MLIHQFQKTNFFYRQDLPHQFTSMISLHPCS
jgi:hypothetical protein